MTNNPDEQPEYDVVEDDDAPLKAKPKRKPKPSHVPWRWVIPAFMVGLGIAALLLFGVLIAGVGVGVPVSSVVQMAVTATPVPLMLPTPPPLTPNIDPSPASGFGGRIEDVVWHGDQLYVARSNPPRLDAYNYNNMNHLGEIRPFNFANEGFDKFVSLAVDPTGQHLVTINTNYMFSSGDVLAEADLGLYNLNGAGGALNSWLKTHSAADINNGNPAIPHLDTAAVYSPDGKLLATGAGGAAKGDGQLRLWDMSNPNMPFSNTLSEVYAAAMGTIALAFTEDGRHLTAVIRADDGDERMNCIDCSDIMVYDVSDPTNPFPLWTTQQAPHFNLDAAKQADISENGRYLAIPQMEDDRIVTGIEIYELPGMRSLGFVPLGIGQVSEIKDLDISDDGSLVAFLHRQVINSDTEQTETLKLYLSQWSIGVAGMTYNTRELASLDALYTAGYFLHVAQGGNFVYYVHPLHGVLNRIDVNSGEHIQMMQL